MLKTFLSIYNLFWKVRFDIKQIRFGPNCLSWIQNCQTFFFWQVCSGRYLSCGLWSIKAYFTASKLPNILFQSPCVSAHHLHCFSVKLSWTGQDGCTDCRRQSRNYSKISSIKHPTPDGNYFPFIKEVFMFAKYNLFITQQQFNINLWIRSSSLPSPQYPTDWTECPAMMASRQG